MKRLFGELERVIGNTRSYWIGEAGNRHRQAYTERKDELETMFTRLEEHPRDLLQISGNYTQAENEIESMVSALETDVISW